MFKNYVYSEIIFSVQANSGDSFYAKIGNVNANKDVSNKVTFPLELPAEVLG